MYTPKISTVYDFTKYQQLNDIFSNIYELRIFNKQLFFLSLCWWFKSTQFNSYISQNVSKSWSDFQISVKVRWRKKNIGKINNIVQQFQSGHNSACAVKVELKVGFLQGKGHDSHCATFLFFFIPFSFAHALHWVCQRCSKAQMSFKKNIYKQDIAIASWCL